MSIINKFELEKVLTPKIVTDCYDVCSTSILAGFEDYTEGIYNGNRFTSYQDAQNNQYQKNNVPPTLKSVGL